MGWGARDEGPHHARRMRPLLLALPLLLLAACHVERDDGAPAATDTARVAVAPPAPAPAPVRTVCLLTTATPRDTLTLYQRPGTAAAVFGTLAPGDTARLGARTADGWLGFDPAVAQAANVGVFRLRWVAPGGPYRLSGPCDALPQVETLPARTCFAMAGLPLPVYARADTTAPVVDSLAREGYAEVALFNAAHWARVRLAAGRYGWVAPADVNVNGDCAALGL